MFAAISEFFRSIGTYGFTVTPAAIPVGVLVFLFVIMLMNLVLRPRRTVAINRLRQLVDSSAAASEPATAVQTEVPLFERAIRPLLKRYQKRSAELAGAQQLRGMEQKITKAGLRARFTPDEFYALKLILAVVIPATGVFLGLVSSFSPTVMLLIIASVLLGWRLPDMWLESIIHARTIQVQRELPFFLDLLTVAADSGMGLDQSIERISSYARGLLAQEFRRTGYEIQYGKDRKSALNDLAQRLGVDDLTAVVNAIIQAEHYGTPISRVLRIQATQVRRNTRARVEEAAQKMSVKIILPVMVFIFAPMIYLVLGPAVSSLLKALGQ